MKPCLKLLSAFAIFSLAAANEADKIAACNEAMLNDFEGVSQDEMMECAELLEEPLRRLEEETKQKEAEAAAAAKKAAEEKAKKDKAAAEAKRKHQEEAAAIALAKSRESEKQVGVIKKLEEELTMCQAQYSSAVVEADSLAACNSKLGTYDETHVPVSPQLKTIFGSSSMEVVVAPVLVAFCILFWLVGCFLGTSRVTPVVNPSSASKDVAISEVVIRPGNEMVALKNRTYNDVDLTGCSLRVADHVYYFDDGYNLAKGTFVEIHAGPDAKDIKKLPIADHDKFDSRRCNKLFWSSASVFLGSGETTAVLLDANDHIISQSK